METNFWIELANIAAVFITGCGHWVSAIDYNTYEPGVYGWEIL